MALFEKAIGYVLENEGGFSDDPNDRGGPTKYGITEAEATNHGYEVRALTIEQAKAIYVSDYWRFDDVADQRIATKLFDMAVNMGQRTAAKIAQRLCGVVLDGVIGPNTVAAINGKLTLDMLRDACVIRYAHIVAADPTQARFIVDWMGRALKVPE